ncbi:hypothetical protein [Bacillus nakamurai]|uniref:hypothetical protein n=1 Tax=Bacillus nakamurai TaxID=1793963 RepID=UPI001E3F43C3|nr:hypothetical protein [Bacillus nakamurai]MCC9021813.1 hypothetical protein [Bacillus nakamurai]
MKTEFDYLNEHLVTLTRLREVGYKCDQEISQVLRCLHKNFFESVAPDSPKNSRPALGDVDAELQKKFHLYAPKLVLVDDDDRGKGKTTLLMRLSQQNSIPVIVGTNTESKMYKHLGEEKDISCGVIPADRLSGGLFPNGVFIDSTVSKDQLKTIKKLGIEIKGGFHHDEVLSSLV